MQLIFSSQFGFACKDESAQTQSIKMLVAKETLLKCLFGHTVNPHLSGTLYSVLLCRWFIIEMGSMGYIHVMDKISVIHNFQINEV